MGLQQECGSIEDAVVATESGLASYRAATPSPGKEKPHQSFVESTRFSCPEIHFSNTLFRAHKTEPNRKTGSFVHSAR